MILKRGSFRVKALSSCPCEQKQRRGNREKGRKRRESERLQGYDFPIQRKKQKC